MKKILLLLFCALGQQLCLLAQTPVKMMFDNAREHRIPIVMAHRMAPSTGYADNAMATLKFNMKHYPNTIQEIDVRFTKDRVAVLNHDATLARTSTGTGAIDARTYADIVKNVRLKDVKGKILNETLPTLKSALEIIRANNAVAMLDMKPGGEPKLMMDVVNQTKTEGNVIVICYSLEEAIDMNRNYPDVMLALGFNSPEIIAKIYSCGLPIEKLVALTPKEFQPEQYYKSIAERMIPVSFSAFGISDTSPNAEKLYRKAFESGAMIICSDSLQKASRVLLELPEIVAAEALATPTMSRSEVAAIMNNAKVSPNYYFPVAHRAKINGSDQYPENSLSAIKNSIESGISVLEIDLKISSDGIVYLMHDDYLQRTTNFLDVYPGTGTGQDSYGKCPSYTWEQVKTLLLKKSDFTYSTDTIPTFADVLKYAKDSTQAILNLDINSDDVFTATWNIVKQENAFDVVIFKTRGMTLAQFQNSYYNALSPTQKNKLILYPILAGKIAQVTQYYNTWEASGIPKGYEVSFRDNVSATDLELLNIVKSIRNTNRVRIHAFSTMPDNYNGRYRGNVNINQCCNNAFDRRGDWEFLLDPSISGKTSGVNGSIITDDPILLDAFLVSIGKQIR